MRILMVSTLYPPFIQGGAEICAHNLATWFAQQGHDVSVLTTAPSPSDAIWDEVVDGCRIFRVSMPRAYHVLTAGDAPGWQKPLWHLQDHFDPRNQAIFDRVLDSVKPDLVNIHCIQGLGYNGLNSLSKRDLPVVFTLHDLGLACVKMSMFKDGKECPAPCSACKASARVKNGYLKRIGRLSFISPSQANLDKLTQLLPIGDRPGYRILNANDYPAPRVERVPSEKLRLLYAGRLHESKGVYVMLSALDALAEAGGFTLNVLGSGPDEKQMRDSYGDRPWIHFAGHVSLQDVADVMTQSDMLLVPSIWLENSPGVVIQALGLGLPVMASDKGGIPELVEHGVTGLLVEAGNVTAWQDAIAQVVKEPSALIAMRENAAAQAGLFTKSALAHQVLDVFKACSV